MSGLDAGTAHALLRAIRFAAEKHRGQTRKGVDASPYINHPIEVAELLARHGVDDLETLQAAVLHDTIEDTHTSPEELEREFGMAVRDLVLEVTDDKALPKYERKRLQIERAPHKSPRAKLIKIADKLCNVRDVAENPPDNWSMERRLEYLTWAENVVAGCRSGASIEEAFDTALAAARARLS